MNYAKISTYVIPKGIILTLILFNGLALADTSWDTGAYTNNEDRSKILSIVNATSLKVKISGNTEKNHDYVYIYDKNGNQLKKLHGNNINETFEIAGDYINARLTTNHSITHSGVNVQIEDRSSYDNRANSMLIRFTNTSHNDHTVVILPNDANATGVPPIYSAPDPDLINNNIYQLEQDINQLVNANDLVELTFIKHDAQFNTTTINLSKSVTHDVIHRLVLKDYVEYSEPNEFVISFEPDDFVIDPEPKFVNDPLYRDQWGLKNHGINLPEAQKFLDTDSGETIVAVIDTGFIKHKDLLDNMLKVADSETDVYGYDFIDNDTNPILSDPKKGSHGTSVAGVIAAVRNNAKGIAGIDGRAKILPVRAIRDKRSDARIIDIFTGNTGLSPSAKAIIWASGGHIDGVPDNKHPATVINLSFGIKRPCENPYTQSLGVYSTYSNAIKEAISRGVTIIAATGNKSASNTDSPANCKGVIAVSATDLNENRSLWDDEGSNYGNRTDVSAPGSEIMSLSKNGEYNEANGTSMAAPFVSGIASILSRQFYFPPREIKRIIRKSARNFPAHSTCTNDFSKVDDDSTQYCGTGIADASQALVEVKRLKDIIKSATVLTLNAPIPLESDTLYKFERTTDEDLDYYINYERTAGSQGLIDFFVATNVVPDSDESVDCKMTFNHGDTLVTTTNTGASGPHCATNIKLKKFRTLYIKVKGREQNGVFDLKGNISINTFSKAELGKQDEEQLKQMGRLAGPVASKCNGVVSCVTSYFSILFERKKRDASHFKHQLDVDTIGLNQTSVNYSKKTPSGNSSVYFIVPVQDGVAYSDFEQVQESLWDGSPGASKVIVWAIDKNGYEQQIVLRVQKKFGDKWIKMNDGVQRDYGQVKVSAHFDDNPDLAANSYTAEFMIIGVGWHDSDYRAFIKAKLDITIYKDFIQNEIYPYQNNNHGVLKLEKIGLNQISGNYSKKTPSKDSSVYFYIPTEQPNVVRSDFTRAKQSLWSGNTGVSKITVIATNSTGVKYQAVLDVQKKGPYGWLKMNDGVQRGFGQVRVSFDPESNPDLPTGAYTTDFTIIGAGWHDENYRVGIKSVVDFVKH
ncbi:extracellular protease [uncultured Gammaproteobacteria bacterium]|nr:extracellular protease [uncultured Gammaproteobacteria bacterium]